MALYLSAAMATIEKMEVEMHKTGRPFTKLQRKAAGTEEGKVVRCCYSNEFETIVLLDL